MCVRIQMPYLGMHQYWICKWIDPSEYHHWYSDYYLLFFSIKDQKGLQELVERPYEICSGSVGYWFSPWVYGFKSRPVQALGVPNMFWKPTSWGKIEQLWNQNLQCVEDLVVWWGSRQTTNTSVNVGWLVQNPLHPGNQSTIYTK